MSKSVWMGIATGAVLVGAIGGYLWWQSSDTVANPEGLASRRVEAPQVPGPAAAPTAPSGTVGMASVPAGQALPPTAPWATGPGAPAPGKLGVNVPAVGKAGAPSIDDIQRRLQGLTANGRQPTAREVDAVLADLQRNQGTDVVAGVNLQALRDNLARADRMQQIAQEVQALAANPRKEDLPRLQALSAEMQRLQTSIAVPAGPATASTSAR